MTISVKTLFRPAAARFAAREFHLPLLSGPRPNRPRDPVAYAAALEVLG